MKIKVIGMHCMGCKRALEEAFKDKNIETFIDLEKGILKVNEDVKIKDIEKIIKKCGFSYGGLINEKDSLTD